MCIPTIPTNPFIKMSLLLGDQEAGLCWLLHKMTLLLGDPGGGAVLVAPQDDPVAR